MKRILITAITAMSAVFALGQSAIATDWQTMGVSSSRETVALDVDSIDRVSQYDVRFRYLIGKDLVQASANCDSAMITPSIGKPFQPHMTGATRTMLNRVCGQGQPRMNYAVTQPTFYVSSDAIDSVRTLSDYSFGREMPTTAIYNDLQKACTMYSRGVLPWQFIQAHTSPSTSVAYNDYVTSIAVVAKSRVCR